jgi:hypothetical protein
MPDGDWFANVESRQHPWPGLGGNTVGLVYDDVDAAVEFYAKALGMVPIAVLPDEDGQTFFARMRYRGTNITLNRPGWDSDLRQTAIERVELIRKCADEARLIDESLSERKDARTAAQRAELNAKLSGLLYGIEVTEGDAPATSAAVDGMMSRVEAYRELKNQIQQARDS